MFHAFSGLYNFEEGRGESAGPQGELPVLKEIWMSHHQPRRPTFMQPGRRSRRLEKLQQVTDLGLFGDLLKAQAPHAPFAAVHLVG